MVELLSSPTWERHVRTLAAALRERCGALAAAVTRELPDWTLTRVPAGGLHLWVRLPTRVRRTGPLDPCGRGDHHTPWMR
ncbi:hypothetical protein GCM10020216_083270 [Nonomuraea helvata]